MGSGRCAGGWIGGVRTARGGTLGAAVGIVNGSAGRGAPLERKWGVTFGAAEGGNLWEAAEITIGAGVGVGVINLVYVAGMGNSVGGILEWGGGGRNSSLETKGGI